MGIFVECVCPSCFNKIYLGDCNIVSGITSGKILKRSSKGMFARMNPESVDGPDYTRELARRECPICGYLLPPNIENVPSITLALVGDTFSGKSHYIAAFIQQLRTEWLNNTSFARFTSLTPEVEAKYKRNYFKPLFTDRQLLSPTQISTQSTAEPLIYNLIVSITPKHPPKTVNLMIYDLSGEAFETVNRTVQVAQFVLNTNAFIFVADPFTMPVLYQKLKQSRQVSSPLHLWLDQQFNLAKGRRAVETLSAILSLFETFHRHPSGSRLPDIPIAVMLSKADLLNYIYPPGMYMCMQNPQYKGHLDKRDIDTVDREVRNLLLEYGQGDLLAATSRLARVSFFATSATGEPPDAMGNFTDVVPCRCLDPVLWILQQLEVIRAG